mgnify:CR=1 FL=1
MRKLYIDNIRWITVVLVVLYHVIYMFNGIETFGVIDHFRMCNIRMHFSISYTHGLCCCCL